MNQRICDNHIEVFIKDIKQAREFQEEFSAFEPKFEHDVRYRMGNWNGKKNFWTVKSVIGGWVFSVPLGFLGRVETFTGEKFPGTKNYIQIKSFLKDIIPELPFKPYNHQLKMILGLGEAKQQLGVASVGAGKSLVLYVLSRYYISLGLKVLCLVPTIDLVHQMYKDFGDYNAPKEFIDDIQQIGGEFKSKNIAKNLVISTWQSAHKADLSGFDVCLNDECHLSKADVLLNILNNPFKIKLGLTGTPPIEKLDALLLEQNFGSPVTYITAKGLIDLGLATDVTIVAVFLNQRANIMKYVDEVKFIESSQKRRVWVSKFLNKLKGLTVALYNHTSHGESTWSSLIGLEATSKNKNDFFIQKKAGIFFISGSTRPKTRKKILDYLKELNGTEKVIVIGQSKILSTGINIKPLKHLVFLSSNKSYTQIIQSIGRVLRLHDSKNKAIVWDLVDNFSSHRKTENFALRHFWFREGYYSYQKLPLEEKEINI